MKSHVWVPPVLCSVLCAGFVVTAWCAVRGKSATFDEPSHAVSAWLMLWRQDYRFSPDVPPLWNYWIALSSGPDAIRFDATSSAYRNVHGRDDLYRWCVDTLYQTPGNDGIELVNHGRAMALILATFLAILIGWWTWLLCGRAVAVVAAMAFYCLDPNFLGNGPLVKNDVPLALIYFSTAIVLWQVGRTFTRKSVCAVLLVSATAIQVKQSGVLVLPLAALVLTARALMKEPWTVLDRPIGSRGRKLAIAAAVCAAGTLSAYGMIWASYSFRYAAGPNGLEDPVLDNLRALPRLTFATQMVLFLDNHHCLPQAFSAGLISTQVFSVNRAAFLCGTVYSGGRWYYFLLAAIFKTPLSTLFAVLLALFVGRDAIKRGILKTWKNRWPAVVIGLSVCLYSVVLVTAEFNIGLRHALPIYPFMFVVIGLAAVRLTKTMTGRLVGALLVVSLTVETVAAFPDYLAFFNVAFASRRLDLLGDSNLDWGQDLPLLAEWQQHHPQQPLYLAYFGLCDPAAYHIHYLNLLPGYGFGPPPQPPTKPGVVAISATFLQGLFFHDPLSQYLRGQKPIGVLGHTIYLFQFDSSAAQ